MDKDTGVGSKTPTAKEFNGSRPERLLCLRFSCRNIDFVLLHETLEYWTEACSITGAVKEGFVSATEDIIRAITSTSDGFTGTQFSIHFSPFSDWLVVDINIPKETPLTAQSLLSDSTRGSGVTEAVDKIAWREYNNYKQIHLVRYARDKNRPGELYFLNLRPKRDEHVTIAFLHDGSVLAQHQKNHNVLRLPPKAGFAIQAMDGETPMRDIYQAMVNKFGLFKPRQLGAFIEQLYRNGMVVLGVPLFEKEGTQTSFWRRIAGKITFDYPIQNGQKLVHRLSSIFGWLYGRRTFVFWIAFVVMSLFVFNFDLDEHEHVFENPMQILDSLTIWGVIGFYVSMTIITAIHELSHALACVRNGGRVDTFGFMLYYGAIAAYCDSTDAWRFPDKWRRIAVSFAGPMSNVIIACIFAWGDIAFDRLGLLGVADVCGALAMLSMLMAIMNLIPLLELDGYYILSDYAGLPRLKQDARAYLWQVLRGKKKVSQESGYTRIQRIILIGYGVLSPLFALTILTLIVLNLMFAPFYKHHRLLVWYGMFLLLATVLQKITTAGKIWYSRRRLKEEIIK